MIFWFDIERQCVKQLEIEWTGR